MLKPSNDIIDLERKKSNNERRKILVLIRQYLLSNGYINSVSCLNQEVDSFIRNFELADNIDLEIILSDYESNFQAKFNRIPKIVKRSDDPIAHIASSSQTKTKVSLKSARKHPNSTSVSIKKLPSISQSNEVSMDAEQNLMKLGVQGVNIHEAHNQDTDHEVNRCLKPTLQYKDDPEMTQLAVIVSREIMQDSATVSFKDIIELDERSCSITHPISIYIQRHTSSLARYTSAWTSWKWKNTLGQGVGDRMQYYLF
jgi:hypothetical protein